MIKKIGIFIFVIFFSSCVQKETDYYIKNLWMISDIDSNYYEFYFDEDQEFFWDGKVGHAVIIKYDSSAHSLLLSKLRKNEKLEEDSAVVFSYLENNTKLLADTYLILFKPIGSYCYKVSLDPHRNYQTFSELSHNRMLAFYGKKRYVLINKYLIDNNLPNSFSIKLDTSIVYFY